MAAFLWLYLLIGPAIMLAAWIWLRSRRDPVSLVEPLEIGRLIGGSFEAFVQLGWPMLIVAVIMIGVPHAAWTWLYETAVFPKFTTGSASQLQLAGYSLSASFALRIVESVFKIPAIILIVAGYQGRPASMRSAMAAALPVFLPVIALYVLQVLGGLGGAALCIVPGILIYLTWAAAGPVLIVERTGIVAALRRSRSLTVGSRGRILLAVLLFAAIVLAFWAPELLARRYMPGIRWPVTIYGAILQIVAAVMATGFTATLYVELRRIREGLSVPGLADVFA